jgi:hypothetical protein
MKAIVVALSLVACATAEAQNPPLGLPTAKEALAIMQPSIDCQWKAVFRYDNGSLSLSTLADQILAVCFTERMKARRAFHLPIVDPSLDADDKLPNQAEAVGNVISAAIRERQQLGFDRRPPVSPRGDVNAISGGLGPEALATNALVSAARRKLLNRRVCTALSHALQHPRPDRGGNLAAFRRHSDRMPLLNHVTQRLNPLIG